MTSPPYTTVSLAKRWMCFFGHKWTAWSDPYEHRYSLINIRKNEKLGEGVDLMQARRCTVCGKRKDRKVR